jgi:hypothetical protein
VRTPLVYLLGVFFAAYSSSRIPWHSMSSAFQHLLYLQSNVTSSSAAAIAKIDPDLLFRAGVKPQEENVTSALPPSK